MAGNYAIGPQSQSTEINPMGTGFINVWNVHVRVTSGPSKGTTFSLDFPEDEHNADDVKKAIEAKIQTLDEVASLGSP